MKFNILSLLLLILSAPLFAETEQEVSLTEEEQFLADEQEYYKWANDVWESLDKQKGKITIIGSGASLTVPDNYYFLNAKDAEKVLIEVWGNPPSETTLGMLFPEDTTPFDDVSWAVTIEYEEDGYVSDEDADDIDYAELLEQMKQDIQASSEWRVGQGYQPIELVGWASNPYYDAAAHKLHWAQEIKFGEEELNTLNYNIRILGRKGVLVLNFIASMEQKSIIESEIDSVLAMAEFDQGSTYSEFDPDIDQIAAYGISALIAGKLLLAKSGFFVAAALFFKKFFIVFIIAIGAFLKSMLSRK